MQTGINVAIFLVTQIALAIAFKWGSATPKYYWWGFAIGNAFGLISTLAYINVFKHINANLAVALCSGGAFLAVQIALAVIFQQQVSLGAAAGGAMIVIGIVMMALL
jgi:multidrug transporter EmrE-like cation transporter